VIFTAISEFPSQFLASINEYLIFFISTGLDVPNGDLIGIDRALKSNIVGKFASIPNCSKVTPV